MTVVVGVAPGHPSAAAVHLGALLARSMDRALVLAAITPAGWTPGGGGVDGEYQRFLAGAAEDAVGRLRADCAAVLGDLDVRVVLRAASSARRGLLDVCAEERAVRLRNFAAEEGHQEELDKGQPGQRRVHRIGQVKQRRADARSQSTRHAAE